jgi:hypothetical protein
MKLNLTTYGVGFEKILLAPTRVSAAFGDLRDTTQALHVAKVMLRGPTDSTFSVAVFDGFILATAAVSAPEAMIKTVGATVVVSDLACLLGGQWLGLST